MMESAIRPSSGRAPWMRAGAIALALASVGACGRTDTRDGAAGGLRGSVTVPLGTVVFSGNRYFAEADLGLGRPVRLMIHGNASMFLMVTHEIGERLIGGPVPKVEEYGYSAKGKGLVRVPTLRFGALRISDLKEVPVFDYVPDGKSPVQGMVGVPFLTAERAAVDFSRDVLVLGVDRSASPEKRLLGQGYRCVPMAMDVDGKPIVQAYFPALGRAIPITPSTVSSALTLHLPPFVGRIPMRSDSAGSDRSPSRTSPALFQADRVEFEIAGARLESPAALENFAEYANVPDAELGSLGLLGFDWMKRHRAIIDYANRFLYFKP